ncbi:MAG: EamA family transporter [Acidobacteria bacterium]|nr:EamA family transporter [Acidobacteriota bacterium]MBS1866721.1 EamA family transporter [Acidobacteriota bacterium]
MSVTQRNSTLTLLAFLAVYVLWGSTYLAMRIGDESFPPLLLAGTRHLVTGLLFYPFFRWKTGIRPTKEHWITAAITGFLLLCVANGGVCWAELTVPSGVAALLVAMVTLWMVIVDWLRPGGHRPSSRVFVGIILGFAGLTLLVGPSHLGNSGRINPWGAAVLAIASFAWAIGSIYSKHSPHPASALLSMSMQCLAGGVALWIGGFLSGELHSLHYAAVSTRSWLAVAYLIVFGSGIGLTAYNYILKSSTAPRVATYAFVNPVVALFLGWGFASEELTLRTLLAAAVILGAVVLVITAPQRSAAPEPEPVPVPNEV